MERPAGDPVRGHAAEVHRGKRGAHFTRLVATVAVVTEPELPAIVVAPALDDAAAQDRWEKENAAAPVRKEPPTTVSSVARFLFASSIFCCIAEIWD